ncbi:conserved hypothetical protein [Histoplasma capsulatum var. duboisii H88]|uniref:Uncharacterized protein n=2 Tax=Ajellomyces capsulatus TaxID=5037 RepID=F0UCZ3_AJEC8|nr:conserved hypothetical protein [Histoplasma capsulatum H143]EGC43420.1 conserved hypothetical protein [Histoplasma capsulatum var. duboisii H88]QSS49600.1 hypothetical protein I7I53_10002 [Histoplasma capsulatum var. duboisii H88]
MNPFLNWAIMLFVSGGVFWYYRLRSPPNVKITSFKPAAEKHENGFLTKKAKRKVKRSPDSTTSNGSRTPPAKPIVEVPEIQKVVSSTENWAGDEGMNNKEFAKQFTKAKEGTKLPSADGKANKNEVRTKTIVSSTVVPDNKDVTELFTRTSSSAEEDADDDLSSANSPVVNPTVPVAGSVSDMLAPAPAVIPPLRLVNIPQVNEQTTMKKQKSENVGETKKQRQRRLKNENRKVMVEESERERRIQLEKHLHTARELERREAAKSKPTPATNAWQTSAINSQPNGLPKSAPAPSSSPLLDTFDSTPQPTSSPSATPESIKASPYFESWANNLPSEEEQIRIIMSESEWTTVSSRKKERKNDSRRAGSVSASDTSSSDFQAVREPRAPIKSQQPTSAAKPTTTSLFPPNLIETFNGKGHPLDSDWDP